MNKRIKVSPNFFLDEFVDPVTYRLLQIRSFWVIDKRVIQATQLIRDLSGAPTTVNDWWNAGQFQHSGFRPPSATVGAALSQHRFGRASDNKVRGMTGKQMAEMVIANWSKFAEIGMTTIENPEHTPTWLHIDCRQIPKPMPTPLIVNP